MMDTGLLKRFAQNARRSLLAQVDAKVSAALAVDSLPRREQPKAVDELEKSIDFHGRESVVERIAYMWFNRFCALRFMDVNKYTSEGIVSPADGQIQPEILASAKMGNIDSDIVSDESIREKVFGLLSGTVTSTDAQGEAYRLLFVSACNYWHKALPFMFEKVHDHVELGLPDDLLSEHSVLSQTIAALTSENCHDVEVIGWLYQFYISEKKDAVFDGLKKNKKVSPQDIPAATQLFTPHWIVRYLVENSLGRLWMLNHPDSTLAQQMEYYIKPEHPESDFLKINKPEDLKICDPACGSGHMLTYAFDLLYAMYEEEGYNPSDIPTLILTNNLYGMEIDERAAALASFALCAKARQRQRTFFKKIPVITPHICHLQPIAFGEKELAPYMDAYGRDLFASSIFETLHQFTEADNFGSLIRPAETNVAVIRDRLEQKDIGSNLMFYDTHQKVFKVLEMVEYMAPRYHVVIANPPYMGGKGMNARLGAWLQEKYKDSKADLFAAFIERNFGFTLSGGLIGMITMQSWMFLSSFEVLRTSMLQSRTILSMAHLGARAFDQIGGEVVSTTAFVASSKAESSYKGDYLRLVEGMSEQEKSDAAKEAIQNPQCGWFYRASSADFGKIPGSPIAYWVSGEFRDIFAACDNIGTLADVKIGMGTGKNDKFLRNWWEVSHEKIDFNICNFKELEESVAKYFPYNKGGDFRLWYGNGRFVVWFDKDGRDAMSDTPGHRENGGMSRYFQDGITWSFISSAKFGVRYTKSGFLFDVAGSTLFQKHGDSKYLLGFLASTVAAYILKIFNPTLNFQAGNIANVPVIVHGSKPIVERNVTTLINISEEDWDSYETSWDFTELPLLKQDYRATTLAETYQNLRSHWRSMTSEMQQLEEENNRIFIEAYGLQEKLTPGVPLREITLTCNPAYRYGGDNTEEELETLLLADTMREFISYAVGCMFGRFSIEESGLILSNQGDGEHVFNMSIYGKADVTDATFPIDPDNVIPILDKDWFPDDIVGRFKEFLRVTFGEEHLRDNLNFVEKALGKDIRKYFIKDFYTDHIKRYKKRPIYWLFTSPKGSFNALIYMHRYTTNTPSCVLNEYLREFVAKLEAEKSRLEIVQNSASASQSDKTRAIRELGNIQKAMKDLDDYERDILYPLATRPIDIDLDDGVKANYPKFGAALKKIPGLEGKEE